MPDINPALPAVGQPDSTEEPKVVTALSQLIAAVNDVDSAQILDGSIALVDLASALQQAIYVPGDIKMSGAAAADPGFLLCDGAAVSRATYSALFAKVGTTHGTGDGTTTFNVPNLSGRSPVGSGTATGAAGATAKSMGQKGGEETHVLTTGEMPSHVHDFEGGVTVMAGPIAGAASGSTTGSNTATVVRTAPTGGGQAHSVMHPFAVVGFQIKT